MNDLDLLKKVKGAAPLDSPEFTGTPKVPTAADTSSDTQIANAQFVSNRVAAVKELLTTDIEELKVKVDKIETAGIDSEAIKNEIKQDLEATLPDDIIAGLGNQSVEISYDDLESRQKSILKQVDVVLDLLNISITDLGGDEDDSKALNLKACRATLESKKSQLVTEYDAAKAAYDICCTNNTTKNYADFTEKLDTWYVTSGDILGYCQVVLNNIDKELLGFKADATQEAIFNILTNNGEDQGIYLAEVTDENGNTSKKLFINGEYAQLYGLTVKDLNKTETFSVSKSGDVSINATQFSLKGKSIDETVQESVNTSTSGIQTTIDNLSGRVDSIEGGMADVSETVKNAIADNIITEAEVNSIKNLYNDMQSRQTAVLKEIDAVLNLEKISQTDFDTLTDHKNSVITSFTDVTTANNNIVVTIGSDGKKIYPAVDTFTVFNKEVDEWNKYVGIARAYCQTTLNNISKTLTSEKLSKDRVEVFNALTDDGKVQGIYMVDITDEEGNVTGGELYINGEYIQSEDFKADNSVTTPILNVEKINNARVPAMLPSNVIVYVNIDEGDNTSEFVDGAKFQTLQGALDACPSLLNGHTVYIKLETDITEDIEIRGKFGGSVFIYMQSHSIFGNIKIWDCSSVLIYGGTNSDEFLTEANKPAISPYKLLEVDYDYYTIMIIRTTYVYLKNLNIYSKDVTTDSVYNESTNSAYRDKIYGVGSSRGSQVHAANVGIINGTNGWFAIRGGKIISQHTTGYCQQNGFFAKYGGVIDIVRSQYLALNTTTTNATGGKANNTLSYDNETINIPSSNFQFCSSGLASDSDIIQDSSVSNIVSTTLTSTTGYTWYLRDGWGWYNKANIVREGKWQSYPENKGFWFFDNAFEAFKGKTIEKLVITVTRNQAGVYGAPIDMHLRYHNFKSKTEATANVTDYKLGPAISNWESVVSIKAGTYSNTFTIDASHESTNGPLAAIQAGTLKGFGLYYDGTNPLSYYQAYSPTMKVTVYYK